jgi:hypothetical protein
MTKVGISNFLRSSVKSVSQIVPVKDSAPKSAKLIEEAVMADVVQWTSEGLVSGHPPARRDEDVAVPARWRNRRALRLRLHSAIRSLAREYLAARSRAAWIPEIEAMIANHHKITRARDHPDWLVEGFRRADWIEVSCGLRRFGLARPFIGSLFATWPSAGFHWRLVEPTGIP